MRLTRTRILGALRWAAVLPAWLLGCLAAAVVVHVSAYLASGQQDSLFEAFSMQGSIGHTWFLIIRALMAGTIGMAAATHVAPRAKRETAFVIAGAIALPIVILDTFVIWSWAQGYSPFVHTFADLCMYTPLAAVSFVVAASTFTPINAPRSAEDSCQTG